MMMMMMIMMMMIIVIVIIIMMMMMMMMFLIDFFIIWLLCAYGVADLLCFNIYIFVYSVVMSMNKYFMC